MKNFNFLVLLCGMAVCSCSESNFWGDNEAALAEMGQLYESSEIDSKKIEGEDDGGPKIETRASDAEIKESMDNYVMELMNRDANSKERVSRSLLASTPLVGVFKVGSCGSYKELQVDLDCEDRKPISAVSGKVGDSYVDGNGNVILRFCMVEAYRYYPGGVLMLDHTYAYSISVGPNLVIVRHHDVEDSSPANAIHIDTNPQSEFVGGLTSIKKNDAILAWGFPAIPNEWQSYMGPLSPIHYGVISSQKKSCGKILIDDEDKNNQNWLKYYHGATFGGDLDDHGAESYGIVGGGNTEYYINLSTEKDFYSLSK